MVAAVLRMLWNTCSGPKPISAFSRPKRLPTAALRSPCWFVLVDKNRRLGEGSGCSRRRPALSLWAITGCGTNLTRQRRPVACGLLQGVPHSLRHTHPDHSVHCAAVEDPRRRLWGKVVRLLQPFHKRPGEAAGHLLDRGHRQDCLGGYPLSAIRNSPSRNKARSCCWAVCPVIWPHVPQPSVRHRSYGCYLSRRDLVEMPRNIGALAGPPGLPPSPVCDPSTDHTGNPTALARQSRGCSR
jgi:hypothetical protein